MFQPPRRLQPVLLFIPLHFSLQKAPDELDSGCQRASTLSTIRPHEMIQNGLPDAWDTPANLQTVVLSDQPDIHQAHCCCGSVACTFFKETQAQFDRLDDSLRTAGLLGQVRKFSIPPSNPLVEQSQCRAAVGHFSFALPLYISPIDKHGHALLSFCRSRAQIYMHITSRPRHLAVKCSPSPPLACLTHAHHVADMVFAGFARASRDVRRRGRGGAQADARGAR